MEKRLFSDDPVTGVRRWFYYDHATDEWHIETEQNVTDLVALNQELAKADVGGYGDMARVASIPLSVYFQLKEQGVIDDEQRLRAWLNDADNRFFRTKLGRV